MLADLAKGQMRAKTAELAEALASNWAEHHSDVATRIIAHIDHLDVSIAELGTAIGVRLDRFEAMIEQFSAVPGVKRTTAEIVIAETGGDIAVFPTPEQLCSWARVAPANHESAGKHHPAGTRNVSRLAATRPHRVRQVGSEDQGHVLCCPVPAHRPSPRSQQGCRRRRHSLLAVLWHLMADPDARYSDLGEDYFDRRQDPAKEADRLVRQLERLGFHATFEPAA